VDGTGHHWPSARKPSSVIENGRKIMLRDDYTGQDHIRSMYRPVTAAAAAGLTPVIAPLALSPEGDALNVDADRAAAMLARRQ